MKGSCQTHFQAGKVHIFDDAAMIGQDHLLQEQAAKLQGCQADFAICVGEDKGEKQVCKWEYVCVMASKTIPISAPSQYAHLGFVAAEECS